MNASLMALARTLALGMLSSAQPATIPGPPAPPAPAENAPVRRVLVVPPEGGEGETIVAVPSTRPGALAPASVDVARARELLEALGSSDASVRERSMQRLLGLRRADLPVLLDAARSIAPMVPEVLEPLRSAVTHIYLTGEPYDAIGTMGFLGITLNPITIPLGDAEERKRAAGEPPVQGIAVTNRLPGVAGYEFLQEGDVILSVDGRGMFRGTDDFAVAVRGRRPGTIVTMRLLRGGRLLDVAIPLSPRPVGMDQLNALDVLRNQREQVALAYWESNWTEVVESAATTRPAPSSESR